MFAKRYDVFQNITKLSTCERVLKRMTFFAILWIICGIICKMIATIKTGRTEKLKWEARIGRTYSLAWISLRYRINSHPFWTDCSYSSRLRSTSSFFNILLWIKSMKYAQPKIPSNKIGWTRNFLFSIITRSTPTFDQSRLRGSGASSVIIQYGWPERLHCTAAV